MSTSLKIFKAFVDIWSYHEFFLEINEENSYELKNLQFLL